MPQADWSLLDCTLRDGGYINEWRWGETCARGLIRSLTHAGIETVEVGFLRSDAAKDHEVTVARTIEELNRFLPKGHTKTRYAAMMMQGAYQPELLSDYVGSGISMIRVTAHKNDVFEGISLARAIQEKGYSVSFNPINIKSYHGGELGELLSAVEKLHPAQFTMVDTFGSMTRRDLRRISTLVEQRLSPEIRIGIHLHENMSMGFCLAQDFLEQHPNRALVVDGSLMGIGRNPGNLPLELIASYLNEEAGKRYEIDDFLDAIEQYIEPLHGESRWGYHPVYFLSAKYQLHRNYAEYLASKSDLTVRDISHILAGVSPEKADVFDVAYIEEKYHEYRAERADGSEAYGRLKHLAIDVDGTMTDGGLYYDNHGNEWKKFQARDAAGFAVLHDLGIKTLLLTGRISEATERRAKELQISEVFQGVRDKAEFLADYLKEYGIAREEIGYIGDDMNDLEAMRLCDFVACPRDACAEVKSLADYVSEKDGGRGVVRDVANELRSRMCEH